jgi:CBS domain-containing protein
MKVRDVMSADVVSVGTGASLREVTARMLREGVGSVIVTRDGDPYGMVTESDVLRAAAERDEPLSSIPATTAMEHPVKTIGVDTTVESAARKMHEHEVKKFPVMDGIDLVGIVTLTDIVWHLSDIEELGDDHFSNPV